MAKVWAISTNKGGVLKTTVTTNLAGVLSQQGKMVLIIDTDNQGNVALTFGINPDQLERTLYDVLIDGIDPEEAIVKGYDNIDILPANDDMAFFEFDCLTEREKYPRPFSLLKNAVDKLRSKYDYILVDTPPNLGLTQGNVLSFVDSVLIPFQPENYSMRSLVKILKAIDGFKEKHNPSLSVIGIVATLVDARTNLHTTVLQECRKFCFEKNIRLFDTVIPRSIRFASSVAYDRLPATLTDKNNQIVGYYFELLNEIEEAESSGSKK
ncbi:ParA family protein [Ammoniphilus resinae]|uniref:Chromosome partitioning protein n=1 Tax=Ammoniphilus resinae TaxID=861532 RepID=A0ABS4GX82_9BACL|nr:ParA family protein [Ammoniphilus resinae]MBP1934877.1 chromosome partitioning protein [Ammoniphilus resinae]